MWALRMGFEGILSRAALPFVTVDSLKQDCSYHSFVIILVLCLVIFIFIFLLLFFFQFGGKKEKKKNDIVY